MTEKITCRYCSAQMMLTVLGHSKNKVYFYECSKCGSRSPMTWNEITANSMATMRLKHTETPNK